jgi:hypothetical protein
MIREKITKKEKERYKMESKIKIGQIGYFLQGNKQEKQVIRQNRLNELRITRWVQ